MATGERGSDRKTSGGATALRPGRATRSSSAWSCCSCCSPSWLRGSTPPTSTCRRSGRDRPSSTRCRREDAPGRGALISVAGGVEELGRHPVVAAARLLRALCAGSLRRAPDGARHGWHGDLADGPTSTSRRPTRTRFTERQEAAGQERPLAGLARHRGPAGVPQLRRRRRQVDSRPVDQVIADHKEAERREPRSLLPRARTGAIARRASSWSEASGQALKDALVRAQLLGLRHLVSVDHADR
jgi:hypothetical protein